MCANFAKQPAERMWAAQTAHVHNRTCICACDLIHILVHTIGWNCMAQPAPAFVNSQNNWWHHDPHPEAAPPRYPHLW